MAVRNRGMRACDRWMRTGPAGWSGSSPRLAGSRESKSHHAGEQADDFFYWEPLDTRASAPLGNAVGARQVAVAERARPRKRDPQPTRAGGFRAHRSRGARPPVDPEQPRAPPTFGAREEGRNRKQRQQLGGGRAITAASSSSSDGDIDLAARLAGLITNNPADVDKAVAEDSEASEAPSTHSSVLRR
ncbi:MAG: hypothetical protein K0S15_2312 [Solirubrobacterales bacterium]|nr:hypothetical protein [Microvirga sp.]MCE3267603.1 hypothetical protein [Solirubrobacterales bacterium]